MGPMTSEAIALLAHGGRAVAAEVPRTWRRLMSVPRVLKQSRDVQVGTTPHDIVLQRGTFRLLRYRRETPSVYAEPILFCYALVNRPYILDLQPDKSVVRRYLERGFDVYLIDWGVPSDEDSKLTIEDYVCGYLQQAVRYVQYAHARKRIHLLGYCMGGTFAAMLTALEPDSIRTLTLLASPIDLGGKESLLNVWAEAKNFDVDAFVEARGNCPADFLQNCFLYIKPVQNLLEKKIAFVENMHDPSFVANYFALERWVNDNIPVAGETFREFVKRLFQQNELVEGKFTLGRDRVDLRRIDCPLLLLTAKNDHLVPPRSTNGIRPHVSSKDITAVMAESGHVGLVVGGKSQKTIWVDATKWLADRSNSTERQISTVPAVTDGSNGAHVRGEQHG
jgi:poly[(R)-3-hydroxyalkanoate] polymerase subunit PhaC